MIYGKLIHPEILSAIAGAGHGSSILIADGNYPFSTACPKEGKCFYLNLSPGIVSCSQVLEAVGSIITIESIAVMDPGTERKLYPEGIPPIWNDFAKILKDTGTSMITQVDDFEPIERFSFYERVRQPECALLIATGEQRVWGNILLTVGVLKNLDIPGF